MHETVNSLLPSALALTVFFVIVKKLIKAQKCPVSKLRVNNIWKSISDFKQEFTFSDRIRN